MFEHLIAAGANLIGGLLGRDSAKDQAQANIANQMLFAKKGIQWRVEDAKKAGVHPLYALGAQTHSFSPVTVGDPLPQAIANMGQDVGRAIHAGSPEVVRQGAFQQKMQEIALERGVLENMLLSSQIAKVNQVQSSPAIPLPTGDTGFIAGQGDKPSFPLYTHDPKVAMVKPPGDTVDTIKFGGLPLIRNPRLFSSGQTGQNEFGEPAEWIIGVPALLEALSRATAHRNVSDYARGVAMQKALSGYRSYYDYLRGRR